MKVFVTGATGFIGSAVVHELLEAGHQVTGLARSDKSAAALTAAGAAVQRGTLEDLESLHSAAVAADGVIHLAFNHDFSDYAEASAVDLRAIETIGDALAGSNKPFAVTGGTLAVTSLGRPATEEDREAGAAPRTASQTATVALAERGIRSSIVRLAPCVHDENRQGFGSVLANIARQKGVSAYVGDGLNRWPAIHRLDAAHLFRLALESAPAGSRLHGAGEEGIPVREIAEAIGRRWQVPVVRIAPEEAAAHFGFLSMAITVDNPTSNALTRRWLGWEPVGPTLVADIEQSHAGA